MEVRYQLRHSPATPRTARVSDPLVKLAESIPVPGGDIKSSLVGARDLGWDCRHCEDFVGE